MQNAKNFLFKGLLVTLLATALFAFKQSLNQNVSASYSLSPAGDVNGDGYADVMVSIFTNEFGISKDGKVQLFLGTGNGLGTSPVWNTEGKGGTNFGESIANAGDVNGDGYFDVIIGASRFSNGEENEGGAFVYYGSPEGLATTPAWSVESNQANAFFGVSVSSAGDVNKDGYADVIVGAHYFDNGETNEGRVSIYLGSSSGLSKTPFFTAEGDQVNAFFGKSVACAGDVNKDGFSDVVIGAPGYDNGQVNEGRAYLYLGTYMGFSLYPDWTFTGSKIDGNMGISVASAGDINGDGYGEIIVGAYGYNPQDPNGDVFVFYGSPSGTINDFVMIEKNKYPGSFIGQSVASAGDTNGDGYSDVLAGVIRGSGPPWKLMVIKGSSKGLIQGITLP